MDLSFNLAPSYRDLKDPTSRQNFEDTVEQKRVIDLIPCLTKAQVSPLVVMSKFRGLRCNSLKEVIDEAVHDAHSFGGHTGVRMHLLQHLVKPFITR